MAVRGRLDSLGCMYDSRACVRKLLGTSSPSGHVAAAMGSISA